LIVVLNERENSAKVREYERDTAAKVKENADNYFKKEVREHMRDAQPILVKAKESQEIKGKLFVAVASVIIIGLVGAFITFDI
jgi:hypothetical protein